MSRVWGLEGAKRRMKAVVCSQAGEEVGAALRRAPREPVAAVTGRVWQL